MNKFYFDGVIVVEGKTDVSYLSSFIESNYFITNGYDLNDEKINFLKRVSEVNNLIILTDNDEAGKTIENSLKSQINKAIALKTRKITRKSYKKLGVAETEKSEIIEVLHPYFTNSFIKYSYNLISVISLSKNPNETRTNIIDEYRLIDGNNKFLEEQLNMLKIKPEEIKQKYGN